MQRNVHVAVIGGGCAGLAAATMLVQQGVAVTVYEACQELGGRARGVNWKSHRLDNGQHIMLGAYQETLRLLEIAGIDPKHTFLRMPLKLFIPGEFELSACRFLPAPLHILAGLMNSRGLTFSERLTVIRFMAWLRFHKFKLVQDETLAGLLIRNKQPVKITKLLWEPICLAALNTPLKNASAQVFLNVLRDSFSKAKSDSDMLLPRQDFSTLMADPLATYIFRSGGSIRPRTAVKQVDRADGGYLVVTGDDNSEKFSHIVVAVPPFRIAAMLGHLKELADTVKLCESLSYEPIYTVYLQYPESARLPSAMIGLTKGYGQWAFDRGLLHKQYGLISVVISAQGDHQKLSQENLAREISMELAEAFPHLPRPLWHKVIAEKRATFACMASIQRPLQETALPGLFLTGDYTAGDYPATIEGAVRSGISCAKKIISRIQQDQ